jgi:hypothetical protein
MFWHDTSQGHHQGTVDCQAKENQVPKEIYPHRNWIPFNGKEGDFWQNMLPDSSISIHQSLALSKH